jgi:hypothetical protein
LALSFDRKSVEELAPSSELRDLQRSSNLLGEVLR